MAASVAATALRDHCAAYRALHPRAPRGDASLVSYAPKGMVTGCADTICAHGTQGPDRGSRVGQTLNGRTQEIKRRPQIFRSARAPQHSA